MGSSHHKIYSRLHAVEELIYHKRNILQNSNETNVDVIYSFSPNNFLIPTFPLIPSSYHFNHDIIDIPKSHSKLLFSPFGLNALNSFMW